MGFGTWVEFGAGRVIVGQNASDALFDTLEETGGSKDAVVVSHNHAASSSSSVYDPGHFHVWGSNEFAENRIDSGRYSSDGVNGLGGRANTFAAATGISVSTSTSIGLAGSSGTNANVQPYIVVKMWKRTA
jgi:hypothetical protein